MSWWSSLPHSLQCLGMADQCRPNRGAPTVRPTWANLRRCGAGQGEVDIRPTDAAPMKEILQRGGCGSTCGGMVRGREGRPAAALCWERLTCGSVGRGREGSTYGSVGRGKEGSTCGDVLRGREETRAGGIGRGREGSTRGGGILRGRRRCCFLFS
jgi:hypothetical protein